MRAARRIVLTRARADDAALRRALGEVDALVVDYPCIEVELVELPDDVRARLERGEYDAAVFVSRHAVEAMPAQYSTHKTLAIGSSTERAIRERGWRVDALPSEPRAEVFARELDVLLPGVKRVLYPRGDLGDDVIPRALRARGVEVDDPIVYRTLDPVRASLPAFDGDTLVVFASPSAVRNFVAKNRATGFDALAIGATTAGACVGDRILVASSPTNEGLVEALRRWLAQPRR